MKAYSLDLRQKIVETYQTESISQRQLAKRFGLAKSFVIKLLKQYRETGSLKPLPHGGGAKLKLSAKELEILAELIEEDNDATLEELCEIFHQRTKVSVSRATMGRMSQRLNLTVKKTFHATEKESERVQKLRTEYWQSIIEVQEDDFVFIDEAGVNLALTRLYARAIAR